MAHKVVKYRLEADGTIPTFLKFGVAQGTGGMYPVKDSPARPRDYVMLGIAETGADISTAVGELSSKDDLTTYLKSVMLVDGLMT